MVLVCVSEGSTVQKLSYYTASGGLDRAQLVEEDEAKETNQRETT